MTPSTGDSWKLRTTGRLRQAWRLGDPVARFFAVAIAAEPLIAGMIVILVALIQPTPSETVQVLFAGLMAIVAQPAFLNAQYEAVLTLSFWEAALERHWLPTFEREYYTELVRYLRAHGGRAGRHPGNGAWALAYMLLYFGTVAGAAAIVVAGWPVLREWVFVVFAAIEVPVALASYRLYGRRTRRWFKEAARQGFRLEDLLLRTNRQLIETQRLAGPRR